MSTTMLNGPPDWMDWHEQFRTRIRDAKLTDYFDGKRPLLDEPPLRYVDPIKAIAEFKAKRYNFFYREEAASCNVKVSIRGDNKFSSDSDATIDTNPSGPIHDQIHSIAIQKRDEEWAIVKDTFIQTKRDEIEATVKAYDREQKDLTIIRDWMLVTVDQRYTSAYFLSDRTLKQWYDDLKAVAMRPYEIKLQLLNQLNKHYDTLKRRRTVKSNEFEQWLREWETLIEKGQRLDLAEALSPITWCETLMNTVEPLFPGAIANYRITLEYEGDNAVTHRKVARDLYLFGRSLDQKEGEERPGRRSNAKRRISETSGDTGRLRCRACYQTHPTERCFYLYLERAPRDWEERSHVRDRVNANIATDSTLRAEAEKMRPKRSRSRLNEGLSTRDSELSSRSSDLSSHISGLNNKKNLRED